MRIPFKHHGLALSLPLGAALLIIAAGAANAAVQINIDKNTQTMTVSVDGARRWTWPVSSGVPNHETPNGSYKAFRMEADHYSKEWDDAPMPHSIFFTKVGHAIHGTDSSRRLGMPASHGCVRLSRENAAKLYALVEEQGVLNTTVTLTGSSQVALANGTPWGSGNSQVAGNRPGTAVASANARQPLGLTPQASDDDPAADPADYQRVPPPHSYQQDYQGSASPPQAYGPPQVYYGARSGYAARGYIQQPYAQQGYVQGYGSQGYYPRAYPNYPGYSHGPAVEDFSRY